MHPHAPSFHTLCFLAIVALAASVYCLVVNLYNVWKERKIAQEYKKELAKGTKRV